MSPLCLPRAIYDDLRAHAEQAYPWECCGALLGRATPQGWQVESVMRATNACAGSARDRYEIAPVELVRILRDARGRGLEVAGFYHSHPDHPAECSATDLTEAHWLGCFYVITEVIQGKAARTHVFLLAGTSEEDKFFERRALQIEDPSSSEQT
jgi:proteasome lid subunit RPN8/RPN11